MSPIKSKESTTIDVPEKAIKTPKKLKGKKLTDGEPKAQGKAEGKEKRAKKYEEDMKRGRKRTSY